MSEPFVSVVTPFHNTGAYVEECIQSVLRQSYRNFEYILVDNASSDGSRDVAERYARTDSRIRIVPTPSLLSHRWPKNLRDTRTAAHKHKDAAGG